MDNATPRNAPCPCGSGKRYKHCHGAGAEAPDPTVASSATPASTLASTLARALELHRSGRLAEAEALYRRALAESPGHPDATHMLAMVRLAQGAPRDARALILHALDATDWRIDGMRTNLGFVLAAIAGPPGAASRAAPPPAPHVPADPSPLVSVVVPSYNHARFVARALDSVRAQDYAPVELVVVDDGSTDDSIAVIERCLRDMPFPARLVARENRGAHAALNEGLAQATGRFVQFLNSDDALAPSRVSRMVRAAAARGASWGFSGIAVVDADDRPATRAPGSRAEVILGAIERIPPDGDTGLALLADNVAVSSGNIFVERELALSIGGFRDFRYNHDWDFCLRALARAEPVLVREPLYVYRLHGANTITEAEARARDEAHIVVKDYLAQATGAAPLANPRAPSLAAQRDAFLATVFSRGMAALLDVDLLRRIAQGKAAL
ncbi:MAG: glycosyltransferase [Burkholderiales bacterium]